ncbi:MAG: hypothetical protein GY861_00860, partial [bacterium]|nr:hypothetical protein [bacterium]
GKIVEQAIEDVKTAIENQEKTGAAGTIGKIVEQAIEDVKAAIEKQEKPGAAGTIGKIVEQVVEDVKTAIENQEKTGAAGTIGKIVEQALVDVKTATESQEEEKPKEVASNETRAPPVSKNVVSEKPAEEQSSEQPSDANIQQNVENWLTEFAGADDKRRQEMLAELGFTNNQITEIMANFAVESIAVLIDLINQTGDLANCATEALGNLLDTLGITASAEDKEDMATTAILVDILIGAATVETLQKGISEDIPFQTSMYAIQKVAEKYELDLHGNSASIEDFTEYIQEGNSAIVWMETDDGVGHYVVVTGIDEDGNFTYVDSDGQTYTADKSALSKDNMVNILSEKQIGESIDTKSFFGAKSGGNIPTGGSFMTDAQKAELRANLAKLAALKAEADAAAAAKVAEMQKAPVKKAPAPPKKESTTRDDEERIVEEVEIDGNNTYVRDNYVYDDQNRLLSYIENVYVANRPEMLITNYYTVTDWDDAGNPLNTICETWERSRFANELSDGQVHDVLITVDTVGLHDGRGCPTFGIFVNGVQVAGGVTTNDRRDHSFVIKLKEGDTVEVRQTNIPKHSGMHVYDVTFKTDTGVEVTENIDTRLYPYKGRGLAGVRVDNIILRNTKHTNKRENTTKAQLVIPRSWGSVYEDENGDLCWQDSSRGFYDPGAPNSSYEDGGTGKFKLTDAEIEGYEAWLEAGSPDTALPDDTEETETEESDTGSSDENEYKDHMYEIMQRPEIAVYLSDNYNFEQDMLNNFIILNSAIDSYNQSLTRAWETVVNVGGTLYWRDSSMGFYEGEKYTKGLTALTAAEAAYYDLWIENHTMELVVQSHETITSDAAELLTTEITTNYHYDIWGYLTGIDGTYHEEGTDPNGHYDENGNLTELKVDRTEKFSYTVEELIAQSKETKESDPSRQEVYDGLGQLRSYVNEDGHAVRLDYNRHGQVNGYYEAWASDSHTHHSIRMYDMNYNGLGMVKDRKYEVSYHYGDSDGAYDSVDGYQQKLSYEKDPESKTGDLKVAKVYSEHIYHQEWEWTSSNLVSDVAGAISDVFHAIADPIAEFVDEYIADIPILGDIVDFAVDATLWAAEGLLVEPIVLAGLCLEGKWDEALHELSTFAGEGLNIDIFGIKLGQIVKVAGTIFLTALGQAWAAPLLSGAASYAMAYEETYNEVYEMYVNAGYSHIEADKEARGVAMECAGIAGAVSIGIGYATMGLQALSKGGESEIVSDEILDESTIADMTGAMEGVVGEGIIPEAALNNTMMQGIQEEIVGQTLLEQIIETVVLDPVNWIADKLFDTVLSEGVKEFAIEFIKDGLTTALTATAMDVGLQLLITGKVDWDQTLDQAGFSFVTGGALGAFNDTMNSWSENADNEYSAFQQNIANAYIDFAETCSSTAFKITDTLVKAAQLITALSGGGNEEMQMALNYAGSETGLYRAIGSAYETSTRMDQKVGASLTGDDAKLYGDTYNVIDKMQDSVKYTASLYETKIAMDGLNGEVASDTDSNMVILGGLVDSSINVERGIENIAGIGDTALEGAKDYIDTTVGLLGGMADVGLGINVLQGDPQSEFMFLVSNIASLYSVASDAYDGAAYYSKDIKKASTLNTLTNILGGVSEVTESVINIGNADTMIQGEFFNRKYEETLSDLENEFGKGYDVNDAAVMEYMTEKYGEAYVAEFQEDKEVYSDYVDLSKIVKATQLTTTVFEGIGLGFEIATEYLTSRETARQKAEGEKPTEELNRMKAELAVGSLDITMKGLEGKTADEVELLYLTETYAAIGNAVSDVTGVEEITVDNISEVEKAVNVSSYDDNVWIIDDVKNGVGYEITSGGIGNKADSIYDKKLTKPGDVKFSVTYNDGKLDEKASGYYRHGG